MFLGKLPLTLYGITALIGAAGVLCLQAGGKPVDPIVPAPAAAPSVNDFPLVAYPPVTPWTAWSARSIGEVRHLKTATGSPRLPTPNPWFPIDLYQGTITRQQFEQKLHSLHALPRHQRFARGRLPLVAGPARPAVRAPIRAAQPTAPADALVSHSGGSSRHVASARQAA